MVNPSIVALTLRIFSTRLDMTASRIYSDKNAIFPQPLILFVVSQELSTAQINYPTACMACMEVRGDSSDATFDVSRCQRA